MITERDRAIFEAGIKLGALYHQWVGTPISKTSAGSIESAIEKAVILQPFVERITVRIDRTLMTQNIFGYSELSGLMFDVEIVTLSLIHISEPTRQAEISYAVFC